MRILIIISIIMVLSPNAGATKWYVPEITSPDLTPSNLLYPSLISAGSDLTCTFTVINNGAIASFESPIQIVLPGAYINNRTGTIPPLQPGESFTITITFPIPVDLSGFGLFQIILDPDNVNHEHHTIDNTIGGFLRILPPGMTPEEYERLTDSRPFTKITELNRNPAPAVGIID